MTTPLSTQSSIEVDLPVRSGNRDKFNHLGVRWLSSFEGNPFLVRAELPSGWNVREKPATDFDKKSFMLIDAEGNPKADVHIKNTPWDQWAIVKLFFTKTQEIKVALAPKPGRQEFDALLAKYNSTIRTTYGCGERGQVYIDAAYAELKTFVEKHPDFHSELPIKHRCDDDGVHGLSGALKSLDGECSIM